jgi:hypothetical protein
VGRARGAEARVRAAPLGAVLALLACAAVPGSGGPSGLAGLHPYVLPRAGRVTLLTCRFDPALPIGVALEPGATREEGTATDAALRAWEGAGLGVHFVDAPADHAQIEVAFRDEPLTRADGSAAAGRTVADCRVGERIELADARVEIARSWQARGGPRAPTREELIGTLVHELGHALGWSGHARRGDLALDAAPEAARRTGERVLAGETLDSPALRALYAVPAGTPLADVAVTPAQTQLVDRFAAVAVRHKLEGPYLRTGDVAARVFWRDPSDASEYGFAVLDLPKVLRNPEKIEIAPEVRARRALPRSRDAAKPSS